MIRNIANLFSVAEKWSKTKRQYQNQYVPMMWMSHTVFSFSIFLHCAFARFRSLSFRTIGEILALDFTLLLSSLLFVNKDCSLLFISFFFLVIVSGKLACSRFFSNFFSSLLALCFLLLNKKWFYLSADKAGVVNKFSHYCELRYFCKKYEK